MLRNRDLARNASQKVRVNSEAIYQKYLKLILIHPAQQLEQFVYLPHYRIYDERPIQNYSVLLSIPLYYLVPVGKL